MIMWYINSIAYQHMKTLFQQWPAEQCLWDIRVLATERLWVGYYSNFIFYQRGCYICVCACVPYMYHACMYTYIIHTYFYFDMSWMYVIEMYRMCHMHQHHSILHEFLKGLLTSIAVGNFSLQLMSMESTCTFDLIVLHLIYLQRGHQRKQQTPQPSRWTRVPPHCCWNPRKQWCAPNCGLHQTDPKRWGGNQGTVGEADQGGWEEESWAGGEGVERAPGGYVGAEGEGVSVCGRGDLLWGE